MTAEQAVSSSERWLGARAGVTVTMPIAVVVVAIPLLVAVSVGVNIAVLTWIPVAGTIGVVGAGLPALLVVVPHAIAWRWLMRRRIGA